MPKTHDESCMYCSKYGYCYFEYEQDEEPPSAQNDEAECVNGITLDCSHYERRSIIDSHP